MPAENRLFAVDRPYDLERQVGEDVAVAVATEMVEVEAL